MRQLQHEKLKRNAVFISHCWKQESVATWISNVAVTSQHALRDGNRLRRKYNKSKNKRVCVGIRPGHASVIESIHTTYTERQQTVKAAEVIITHAQFVSYHVSRTRHTCLWMEWTALWTWNYSDWGTNATSVPFVFPLVLSVNFPTTGSCSVQSEHIQSF